MESKKSDSEIVRDEKTKRIRARTILWYLIFTLTIVDYMCRITLNIAIINMVVKCDKVVSVQTTAQCIISNNTIVDSSILVSSIHTQPKDLFSIERALLGWLQVKI